jgi:hypothetical protein
LVQRSEASFIDSSASRDIEELARANAPAWTLFALVGAAKMAFGFATIISVRLTRWG